MDRPDMDRTDMDRTDNDVQSPESPLWKVLEEMRAAGQNVQPLKSRIGYFLVDGHVASAEALVRKAASRG